MIYELNYKWYSIAQHSYGHTSMKKRRGAVKAPCSSGECECHHPIVHRSSSTIFSCIGFFWWISMAGLLEPAGQCGEAAAKRAGRQYSGSWYLYDAS